MESRTIIALISIFVTSSLQVSSSPVRDQQQEYRLDAYRDRDAQTLILRIQPINNERHPRQEDEDESGGGGGGLNYVPTVSPFIPAVIPALTKIITGIFTGNLNDIFHGSTSFAPQNISHHIDTVYNQVVGLAPPTSTTRRPLAVETTVKTPLPPVPQTTRRAVVTQAPPRVQALGEDKETYYIPGLSPNIVPGQPFGAPGTGSSGSIVFTTKKPIIRVSNEDDDES